MGKIDTIKRDLLLYADYEMERVQIQNILTRLRGEMKKGFSCQAAIDLENLYVKKLDDISQHKRRVEKMLSTLQGDEHTLMMYRYVNGLTWEKICEAMYFSNTNAHRIHRKALEHLAENVKG